MVPPWMELRREEASEEDDVAEELFSSRSWGRGRAEIQYKQTIWRVAAKGAARLQVAVAIP